MNELMVYLVRFIALMVAIVGHEVAHGYVAYLNGDLTAKVDGRLSLNPFKHLDPIGFIALIVFRFGWAKPVPINPYAFRKRKLGMITVSLAGVVYNLIMAFLFSGIFVYLYLHPVSSAFLTALVENILWYNIMLGLFNLIPLPPLDGSKVLASFFPRKLEDFFYRYERYLYILLVVAIFSGAVNRFLTPIFTYVIRGFLGFWGNLLHV